MFGYGEDNSGNGDCYWKHSVSFIVPKLRVMLCHAGLHREAPGSDRMGEREKCKQNLWGFHGKEGGKAGRINNLRIGYFDNFQLGLGYRSCLELSGTWSG